MTIPRLSVLLVGVFLFTAGIYGWIRYELSLCTFHNGDKVLIDETQPGIVTNVRSGCVYRIEWFSDRNIHQSVQVQAWRVSFPNLSSSGRN